MNNVLYDQLENALLCTDPFKKCQMTDEIVLAWHAGLLSRAANSHPQRLEKVGRPLKPSLVHPRELTKRSIFTEQGRIVFMHAIAHIEFNAINLALDAAYRFRDMPDDYYGDWLSVASEEVKHFRAVCVYLEKYSAQYGDFPGHDGLWDMTLRTDHDVLVRMALVPRVMEARGLDVTPKMIADCERAGDPQAAAVLSLIYTEEIRHVEIGSRWFVYCCEQRNLNPETVFFDLIQEYMRGSLRGPFNDRARRLAGFSEQEIQRLNALS
ncbi:MAG: ferritin-like domain-containing protein [Gammaproteobacteria bacterium]|nr:ferritin-like domain-containing protein [Gammaproteobacteria bacterium]